MRRPSTCFALTMLLIAFAMHSAASAEDYTKPTKQHEAMAEDVGVWDADVSMWMSPDAEPMKSKAVEKPVQAMSYVFHSPGGRIAFTIGGVCL